MSGIIMPADEVRRQRQKRRIQDFIREGMSQAQAVRAAVAIEMIQRAREAKLAKAVEAAGGEAPTPKSPPRIIYKDTAVDRVAKRIKDFIQSRSSEQAHRIAVETAQRAERTSAKE